MYKKKIVIITHIIFPAMYPRAYRATELAKEFARQGNDVTIYAVLGDYDYGGFEQEHGLKVRNLGRMRFVKLNSDGSIRNSIMNRILNKLLNWILEFPDIEFMFHLPRVIRSERNTDLLISVTMPHPINWGCALSRMVSSKQFPQAWIADCGDPYMGNKFINKPFYFKYVEKWFCKRADYITIPTEGAKSGYYKEFHDKLRVIPQGFKFENIDINPSVNPVTTFAYAGAFYKNLRDPSLFLEYLATLKEDFKFVVYTPDQSLLKPYLNKLKEKIEIKSYIPRKELLRSLSAMDFLINFDNGTSMQSPSKLIDYALTKRPILTIPSDSIPSRAFQEFLQGNYSQQTIVEDTDQYRIENVAKSFMKLVFE